MVIHSKFCQDVLVIEELLPVDCLNVNESFCSQPLLSKQSMEFQETYTEYIWLWCDEACEIS